MKKVLTIAAASLAFAALAYTAPQIGVKKITTSSINTIIPVPFYALSDGTSAVTAKDLVKTTGLADNTWMLSYNGTGYSSWMLKSGAWTSAQYVNSALPNSVSVSAGADSATLAAGGAIWIIRPSATSTNIVVYGAYSESVTSTVTAGTAASPKANLICNPTDSATVPTLDFTPTNKDKVVVIGSESTGTYVYSTATDPDGWKQYGKSETVSLPEIPAYGGFWYISKGGSGTISW